MTFIKNTLKATSVALLIAAGGVSYVAAAPAQFIIEVHPVTLHSVTLEYQYTMMNGNYKYAPVAGTAPEDLDICEVSPYACEKKPPPDDKQEAMR